MTQPTPSAPRSAASLPDQDRRVWVRYPASADTPIFSISDQEEIINWKARVRDISEGGIRLTLHTSFPANAAVDIIFPAAPFQPARTVTARVVRSEAQDDTTWTVACAFLHPVEPEDLKKLLEA